MYRPRQECRGHLQLLTLEESPEHRLTARVAVLRHSVELSQDLLSFAIGANSFSATLLFHISGRSKAETTNARLASIWGIDYEANSSFME